MSFMRLETPRWEQNREYRWEQRLIGCDTDDAKLQGLSLNEANIVRDFSALFLKTVVSLHSHFYPLALCLVVLQWLWVLLGSN